MVGNKQYQPSRWGGGSSKDPRVLLSIQWAMHRVDQSFGDSRMGATSQLIGSS